MNWTGGRLQRYSKSAINSVAAKQRQHFAKVRARLENGTRSPTGPFQPDFLPPQNYENPGSRRGHSQGYHLDAREARQSQRRLEECDSTAPGARRLSALGRRSTSRNGTRRPVTHRSRQSSKETHALPRHRQASRYGPDNHESLDRKTSRKRKADNEAREDDVVEANRKRLLRQQDWIGLNPALHLMMEFPARQSKIGRRRKVTSDTTKRKAYARDSNFPPIVDSRADRPEAFMSGSLMTHPESIDVRIGTAALQSQTTVRHSRGTLVHAHQSPDDTLFERGGTLDIPSLPGSRAIGSREQVSTYAEDENASEFAQKINLAGLVDVGRSDDAGDAEDSLSRYSKDSSEPHTLQQAVGQGNEQWNAAHHSRRPPVVYVGANSVGHVTSVYFNSSANDDADNFSQTAVSPPVHCEQSNRPINESGTASPQEREETVKELNDLRKFLPRRTSVATSKPIGPHGEVQKRPSFGGTALPAPFPQMIPLSQRATAGSSLSAASAEDGRDLESTVRRLQSPSPSLRNILRLAHKQPAEPKTKSQEATNEEIWKWFVFGSSDDRSTASGQADSLEANANHSYEHPHASSLDLQVAALENTQSDVQHDTRAAHARRPEHPRLSLFIQGSIGSAEYTMGGKRSSDTGDVNATNVTIWGSGTNEVEEENLQTYRTPSEYQSNIHAVPPTLRVQGSALREATATGYGRSDNIPTSDETGDSSALVALPTTAKAPHRTRHASHTDNTSKDCETAQENSNPTVPAGPTEKVPGRIIFTKPCRYSGTSSGAVRELVPLHIGRTQAGRSRRGNARVRSNARRHSPSIYDFPVSTSDEEIED